MTGPSIQLVIVGGGGHALVVAEGALLASIDVAGFLDDDATAVLAEGRPGVPRLGSLAETGALRDRSWILGMGDLATRRAMIGRLGTQAGAHTVVHPRAIVSPFATIGPGAYLGPGSVIHTRAGIGAHAIINSGAIVEHECAIGENVHVAPGAVLAGRVRVGADTLVGLGSRVLPGLSIGRGCTIGSGAVVTRDVPDGAAVAGVPARSVTLR